MGNEANQKNAVLKVNDFMNEVHDNAIKHGWWENKERNFGELIALCHSELSEALEEEREGRPDVYFIRNGQIFTDLNEWNGEKLEGIGTELADCIIRIFDLCAHREINLEQVICFKHYYNRNRPYKHGNKKF